MQQTIVDVVDGATTYKWYAEPWRASSSPYWTIQKITTSWWVVTTMYPTWVWRTNSDEANFIWDDRTIYTYWLSPDLSAPTLTTVTLASNNTTTTLAKVWDIVTITIIASEWISTPTVTIWAWIWVVTLWIDHAHYTAAYTMTSWDTTWTVTFTINFADKAWTAWTQVTAKTGWNNVTFDKTTPTFTTLTMASNNSNTALAKEWDIVTLTVVWSEALKEWGSEPVVSIAWHTINPTDVTWSAWNWSVVYTMVSWDSNWTVSFSIIASDLAWNSTWTVSTLTWWVWVRYDKTLPTATTVTIASNNADTTRAKTWDIVTLTVITSEAVATPVITIRWAWTTEVQGIDALHWTAPYTMQAWDTEWVVPFTLDFTDLAWNAWVQVTTKTWWSNVTFDKTLPTLSSVVDNSVTQLEVTLSELAIAWTITKANAWWFVVYETWTPLTTYAVSWVAPWITNDLAVLTVADMTASAIPWVTVTYVAWWNWTVADPTWNLLATNAIWVATWAF